MPYVNHCYGIQFIVLKKTLKNLNRLKLLINNIISLTAIILKY